MASPHAMRPSDVVSIALRDGGPAGLFRGNTATLVKIMPASAVQFAVYEALRDALKATGVFGGTAGAARNSKRGAGPEHFIAGFVAGAAQCLVSHPLETIRTLMSVPGCTSGSFFQVRPSAQRCLRGHASGLHRVHQSHRPEAMHAVGQLAPGCNRAGSRLFARHAQRAASREREVSSAAVRCRRRGRRCGSTASAACMRA